MESFLTPFNIVKTLQCTYNELSVLIPTGISTNYDLNTTLNHKYNILPNDLPSSTPKLKYYGIGIKGFKNLNDQQLSAPYVPQATNMDLYQPIPLKIVPVNNDLTSSERSNYRMRVRQTINGNDYYCYYLKKLEYTDNHIKMLETDLNTKQESEIQSLDPSNLNPSPVATSTTGNVNYSKILSVCVDLEISILGQEIIDIINILFNGDLNKAKISEIGLYSGEDKSYTTDGVTYLEGVYVQLAYLLTWNGSTFETPDSIITRQIRLSSASAYLL